MSLAATCALYKIEIRSISILPKNGWSVGRAVLRAAKVASATGEQVARRRPLSDPAPSMENDLKLYTERRSKNSTP